MIPTMRKIYRSIAVCVMAIGALLGSTTADAQYYEIANQIPQLIQPALVGRFNYKGFVEASFVKGIGSENADFLGVTTSQGFRYSNWFFMGVGAAVDVVFAHPSQDLAFPGPDGPFPAKSTIDTGVMIPLFTDFRFSFGNTGKVSFYSSIKLGCSFLMGDNYLRVGDGYLTSQQYFLFKPSIGVKIPVVKDDPRKAVEVGLTYQLLTSNYYTGSWNTNTTLNALGLTVAYQW